MYQTQPSVLEIDFQLKQQQQLHLESDIGISVVIGRQDADVEVAQPESSKSSCSTPISSYSPWTSTPSSPSSSFSCPSPRAACPISLEALNLNFQQAEEDLGDFKFQRWMAQEDDCLTTERPAEVDSSSVSFPEQEESYRGERSDSVTSTSTSTSSSDSTPETPTDSTYRGLVPRPLLTKLSTIDYLCPDDSEIRGRRNSEPWLASPALLDTPRSTSPNQRRNTRTERSDSCVSLQAPSPTVLCGIIGLLLHDPASASTSAAATEIAEGLSLLQHRGQDACGIVTCGPPRGRFYQVKANGMVRDVFDSRAVDGLKGGMGIGHVRYPTAGSSAHSEAQPFYVNSPYGIVMAHNGNVINTPQLRTFLDADAHRHINTDSDSELILNIFANNLQKTGKFRINEEDIFTALGSLMNECKGAYTCTAMLAGFGMIAFRDPNGIRPVGLAKRKSAVAGAGPEDRDYLFASESVVADALGFSDWEDVAPGEVVIITKSGITRRKVGPQADFAPDIFEYVYFARPDSTMDGISVYRARMAMGDLLAEEVRRQLAEAGETIDVVIPVPDTSRVAALQVAQSLNIPYREGFVKNRYVGRTFIMPGQSMRRKNVRRKLNAMPLEFAGKNVLLVDDSIVRGTTSKEIIQMAKDVGAKKVLVASCAPPIRFSNVYGIDMPSPYELVAHGRTTEEIATEIGADRVIFQTLSDLIKACNQFNPSITKFDCSVFTGEYVTGGVDQKYIDGLISLRNDNAKIKAQSEMPGVANPQELEEKLEKLQMNCNGPMNGADSTMGIYNGTSAAFLKSGQQTPNGDLGLHNSWHHA